MEKYKLYLEKDAALTDQEITQLLKNLKTGTVEKGTILLTTGENISIQLQYSFISN